MGDLEVDLLGLTRLATALDRIAHGLEVARGELRGADSLGDEQVVYRQVDADLAWAFLR